MTKYTLGLNPVELAASADEAVVISHIGGSLPAAIAFGSAAPIATPSEGLVLNVGQSVALWGLQASGVNVYGIGAGAVVRVDSAATTSGVKALVAVGESETSASGGVIIAAAPAIEATAGEAIAPVDLNALVFPVAAEWRVGVARPAPAWLSLSNGVLSGTPPAAAALRTVEFIAFFDNGSPLVVALDVSVSAA